MINKIKQLPPAILFFIKFGILMLSWELVYSVWLEKDGSIDSFLTNIVTNFSVNLLQWSDYPIESMRIADGSQQLLLEGQRLLRIAHPCNGLILEVLFIVFLLSFKGDKWIKTFTILIGCVGIYLINVLRVYALVLIQIYHPEWLDFSHKYLFTALVYAFVFSIWLLWVNKLSTVKFNSKSVQ